MKAGEPIWLDDGKIGSVIRKVNSDQVSVEITQARPAGEKLGVDRTLSQLERAQRMRLGQPVAPRIDVNVSSS
jgi:pyruvate kinase